MSKNLNQLDVRVSGRHMRWEEKFDLLDSRISMTQVDRQVFIPLKNVIYYNPSRCKLSLIIMFDI